MVFYITCLKALAACLITNAHYTGIYPTDLIANGGLIGDIIFFAVSGYCLYNVKESFPKWYGKRLWRVYPPVLLMTAVYLLLGEYSLADHSAAWWFIYPTYYHFVASIIVLYIPFYFIVKSNWMRAHIPQLMAVIGAAWFLVYIAVYDKSYYHIDTVREPMIRFLFMESMLLGAWFRQNDKALRDKFSWIWPVGTAVCFAGYFASKLLFSKWEALAPFQFMNQLIIFALLFMLMRCFAGVDNRLSGLPACGKQAITFVADITLEIYVVQYVLIWTLCSAGRFPLNWLAVTASIFVGAYLLHLVCRLIYKFADRMAAAVRRRKS